MAKDPFIAKAKLDAAARDFVNKNEYTLKQAGKPVYGYRDAQGNVMQMSKEDLLNKDFDLGTWYKSMGFSDYIKPGMEYLDKAPEMKYMLQTDKGLTLAALGQIPFYRTGKGVSNVHKQTIENMLPTITMLENMYLDNPSAFAQRWRVDQGIEDLDHNKLVNDVEARNRATNFITELAKTKVFDNTSNVTDYDYGQLSIPKGGSGDGDEKPTTPPKVGEAGSTPEQYVKEQYDRISATNKDQIKKDLTMRVAKIIGDPSINRNDKTLQAEFKKISKPDGSIDPDKLVNYDLSRLNPYLAGNSTLAQSMGDLYTLQSDYSTLQQVDDEADVIAKNKSGYTDTKYKSISDYTPLFTENTSVTGKPTIIIDDNGTIYQDYSGLTKHSNGEILAPGLTKPDKILGTLPKDKIKLAQEYLKDQETNTKLKNYKTYKKEESEKLLKSALEKQSKVKYLDFNNSKDQTEFDGDVQSAIIVAMNTSADDAGNFTNWRTGKKQKLPVNVDFDKSKYRGHIKTPDGTYKTLFSVYNTEGKELGVYTLDKTPDMLTSQYVQGSIDPTTGINYEDVFDDISTSFSEQSKDSSKPESTLLDKDTRPVGYTKSILHNNRQVATMRIDNVNQRVYTLTPDIIAKYNKLPPYYKIAGKDTVSNTDAFNIDDVSKIVTLALTNQ
jgi:hypothetical protein